MIFRPTCQTFICVCSVAFLIFHLQILPPGSTASREVLCLPLGHWRHAEGYGGFGFRAWQEAQGDHGRRQTGNTYGYCHGTDPACGPAEGLRTEALTVNLRREPAVVGHHL